MKTSTNQTRRAQTFKEFLRDDSAKLKPRRSQVKPLIVAVLFVVAFMTLETIFTKL